MGHRIVLPVLSTAVLLAALPERAPAVVMGAYAGIQEVTVSDPSNAERNNTICNLLLPQCRAGSPGEACDEAEPGTWNVFGVDVTPVPIVCRRTTVNGVAGDIQCKTVDPVTYAPDGQLDMTVTAADAGDGTSTCIDPPDCGKWSLINTVTTAAGSVHDAIRAALPPGGRVLYTSDGMEQNRVIHFLDGYTPQIPAAACQPQSPAAATLSSETRASVNVFADQETPAGAGVLVSTNTSFFNPITQQPVPVTVDVTFAEVTQAGATMVAVQSNHGGGLSGFSLGDSGFQASFLEITSTASYTGPIEVCTHYPDVDDDGVVDGSTLLETELKLLHGENGAFVNRTSTQDVDANVICGIVEHFSPFVAAPPRPCAPAPRTDCTNTFDTKSVRISIDEADPSKNKFAARLKFQMSNVPNQDLRALFGDPLDMTAYQLCLYDEDGLAFEGTVPGARTLTLEEPWRAKGSGYGFKDKTGTLDGITAFLIKRTDFPANASRTTVKGMFQLKGKGPRLPLPALPLTVADPPKVTLQFMSMDPLGVCIGAALTTDINTATDLKAK